MNEKKKVVVGLSGGVDSSVAAYLLKEQGYDVIGVTMQIWQDNYSSDNAESISAINDAKAVAEKLEIPYYVLNFRNEFKENIISYFIDEYFKGRTPNPCTVCNRFIKWEALLKRCKELGADFVATGHYAGIDKLPNGRYSIKNSVTATKDQTYALYNLTQEQLAHTIMPLGNYTKDQVRAIAADLKLPIAAKPDSMDICFVPDGDYAGFIKEYSGKDAVPGNFVDTKGNILGQHNGIIHYTVGQRKGLGLSMGHPVFVVKVKPETNEVVIGENDDIFSRTLYADRINFMSIDNLATEMRVTAKIRYNHKGAPCTIKMIDNDLIECTFDEPVRAITPGQAVVFYDSDYVVGGGTII